MENSIENEFYKILGRMSEKQQQLKMVIETLKNRLEPHLVKLFDMLELSMQEQIEAVTTIIKRDRDRNKTKKICDYCKRPGHIRRNCFELLRYSLGWQERQQNKSLANGNIGRRWNHGHFISAVSSGKPSGAVTEALEEYKSKLMSVSNNGLNEHAASFHSARGSNSLHEQNNYNGVPWIIDSGAKIGRAHV